MVSLIAGFLSDHLMMIICLFLLGGYWAALYIWGNAADPLSIQGNAGYRLDSFLFGDAHLYRGRAGIPFDPEGVLSTFPAVVNVVGGYWAGRFLRRKGINFEGIARLLMSGCVLVLAAVCWNAFLPVNKKLWTSSFVCLTIGLDLIILSFLVFFLDIKGYRQWSRFFTPFGKNPLFIYLLSELLITALWNIPCEQNSNFYKMIGTWLFSYVPGGWGSLLFAVSYMLLCWLIGWILDRRKIYIKV